MTTFKMKPESEIILSSSPKNESKLNLIAWKILINVKRMLKDWTMDVEMSQAVAWIKGTIFELEETWTESKLKVFEWTVEFTSKTTWEKSMVWIWETQTATEKWLLEKTTRDNKEVFKKINKERQEWEKMKEVPLKPLLLQEEINKIRVRDLDRWEIKLDPDSIAPDWHSYIGQKNNKKNWNGINDEEKSSGKITLLILLIIIISIWFLYLKFKGKKEK
jgi:hypothetical protein